MADPFSVDNAPIQNENGFLGVSPDTWRNLMNFGAQTSMAANARGPGGFLEYGSGWGGPVGAGITGAENSARALTSQRANLANLGEETQARRLQNTMTAMQLPLVAMSNQQAMDMMQQFPPSALMGAVGMGAPGQPYTGGSQPFTGDSGANSNAQVVPPEQRQGMLQQAVAGTPIPVPVLDAVVQHESGWNSKATNDRGDLGLTQINHQTAAQPGFAMPPMDQQRLLVDPQYNLSQGAQYLYRRGQAAGLKDQDWNDPNKVATALAGYHSGVDNPRYVSSVMGELQQGPSWARQAGIAPGGIGPDPALMQQAQILAQQARMMSINPVLRPQAAILAQQAKEMMDKAFIPYQANEQAQANAKAGTWEKWHTPLSMRDFAVDPSTGRIIARNPQLVETQDEHGRERYQWVVPPPNIESAQSEGGPSSVSTGLVKELGPGEHEAIHELGQEFYGEAERKQFATAQSSLYSMDRMMSDLQTLNKGQGWSQTGPIAPEIMAGARTANQAFTTLGIKAPFNPEKIANYEDLVHQQTIATGMLVNQFYGASREAAATIARTAAAVPGPRNTPAGAAMVTAANREIARMGIDHRNFVEGFGVKNEGDLRTADAQFFQMRTPEAYSKRALSYVQPVRINTPGAMKGLLPGTVVIGPHGGAPMVIGGDLMLPAPGGQQEQGQ